MSDDAPAAAERRARGMAVRRKVLGDAYVDGAIARTGPLEAAFQDWIAEAAWGTVWSRPGLPLRERSLLVLAITAALGRWEEFELHCRSAPNAGASDEDVAEALLHVAVYAGAPAANTAHAIFRRLRGERAAAAGDA